MTTWSNITDAEIAVDKAIKASTHRKMRDNITAVAEGAAGAPRVTGLALNNIVEVTALNPQFAIFDESVILNETEAGSSLYRGHVCLGRSQISGNVKMYSSNLIDLSGVSSSEHPSLRMYIDRGGVVTTHDSNVNNGIVSIQPNDFIWFFVDDYAPSFGTSTFAFSRIKLLVDQECISSTGVGLIT